MRADDADTGEFPVHAVHQIQVRTFHIKNQNLGPIFYQLGANFLERVGHVDGMKMMHQAFGQRLRNPGVFLPYNDA
jgi:hypothetical protein